MLRIKDVKQAAPCVLSYFNFSTFIAVKGYKYFKVTSKMIVWLFPGVVPDGAASSVTSARHILAVSMATVTDHPGSASVTRTGEEYCVIKVCSIHYKTWLTCEPWTHHIPGRRWSYGFVWLRDALCIYSTAFRYTDSEELRSEYQTMDKVQKRSSNSRKYIWCQICNVCFVG